MGMYTVETRELEDLRRKHAVACGLVSEQGTHKSSQIAFLKNCHSESHKRLLDRSTFRVAIRALPTLRSRHVARSVRGIRPASPADH